MIKINSNEFVHLHINTEYSLIDSACRLEELFHKAKSFNMNALAITDKNTISGVLRFYQLSEKYDMHPVIGCQMRITEEEVLVLLATGNIGYKILVKWINSGFPAKPALNGEIIALSGGCNGAIYSFLNKGEDLLAEEMALKYEHWFGKGNFYLEIQQHNFKDDSSLIKKTAELSKKTGIPLVATHCIQYLEPEDAGYLNILKVQNSERTETGSFYFPSPEEMKEKFRDYPEALKNTLLIAKRCKFNGKLNANELPHYPVPDNEMEDSFLRKLCLQGLEERFNLEILNNTQKQNIIKRLNYELDIITKRRLCSYFLIV